jgi:RND family efflux transporter MFP subunit
MRDRLFFVLRLSVTAAAAIIAVAAAGRLWVYYELAPWTRDGRIRADIVSVSPDVAGFVVNVAVVDNQSVRKGQRLFQLDPARYQVALQEALAAVARERALLAEARREARRDEDLADVVAIEARQQDQARVDEDAAALQQGLADVAAARLNLQRTLVVARVNGVVTNLDLRPGDYLVAGKEAFALVDTDSLHVDGYFEETKLPRIRVGDPASVQVMGERQILHGRVHSIAAAIDDRERTPSANLVANINPTFNWVRLAQRVPVRIVLDSTPTDVRLIAGRTATVVDLAQHAAPAGHEWWSRW